MANFFFQAEDGIRDGHVTGVQTCALPIFLPPPALAGEPQRRRRPPSGRPRTTDGRGNLRSEERRVGKEWTFRRWSVRWKRKMRHEEAYVSRGWEATKHIVTTEHTG